MTKAQMVLRLLRREQRGGLRGFYVFIASLLLGVVAIAGIGSISSSMTAGLKLNGQRLLGGDVDLRLLHRNVTEAQRIWLTNNTRSMSEVVKMRAMARPGRLQKKRTLVELKAVDNAYPLNAEFIANPDKPLSELLKKREGVWGAVVDVSLLSRLNLKLGEYIKVGNLLYQLRATVKKEPDRIASLFSFGPRVMVARTSLVETGLIQPGSQIHYHIRTLLPSSMAYKTWIENLNKAFPQAGWRIRGTADAAPGVQRFLDRMNLFFSFVGLTVLLIGGIGVASTVSSFLKTKVATIATLKCLGASGHLVFLLYFAQVMVIGTVGVALGCLLGGALPFAFDALVGTHLPVRPIPGFYSEPIILAALFGLTTAGTFTIWPLARAREVPAAALFRDIFAPIVARPKTTYILAIIIGVAFLVSLILWSTTDWNFAAWFIVGTLASFGLLFLGAKLVKYLASIHQGTKNATLRMAFGNLYRPGAATLSVIVSLGLGLSVLAAIALIEENLSNQIKKRLPDRAPAFFFMDIQPHQVVAFDAALSRVPGTSGYQRVPTLRGRIIKIAGLSVDKAEVSPETQWAIRGDRALTYAAQKREDTEIIKGKWWPPDYKGPPIISLDSGLARGFGIDVGDTLSINVLGREVTATVTNLRKIDWRSLRFDFAIIFAPGTLDSAPHTYIAAIAAPKSHENEVEAAATDQFPNISAIRVRDALQAAAQILAGVGGAIRGIAALTLLAGVIVLAGSLAASRRQRTYESVVFKVLGATRLRLAMVFIVEYGMLGLVTGLIAAGIGSLAAWAVVKFLLHMEWNFLAGTLAATLVISILVTLCIGFFGNWRTLSHPAAPFLRNK